jgi:hypothetical protein
MKYIHKTCHHEKDLEPFTSEPLGALEHLNFMDLLRHESLLDIMVNYPQRLENIEEYAPDLFGHRAYTYFT